MLLAVEQTKFLLEESQLPRRWYNIASDMPSPPQPVHFDMAAYDNYFAGKLVDVALDEDEIQRALHAIEGLPTPA